MEESGFPDVCNSNDCAIHPADSLIITRNPFLPLIRHGLRPDAEPKNATRSLRGKLCALLSFPLEMGRITPLVVSDCFPDRLDPLLEAGSTEVGVLVEAGFIVIQLIG
jgi:hypothetical protein